MEYKTNGQTIEINNAKIIFKNFSGKPGVYNKEGDRNFCLLLPDDAAVDFFRRNGYSPTVKPSTSEEGEFFRYIKVKLKFNQWGPTIILKSGDKKTRVDENLVSALDSIRIESVDMDIRPYHWERPNGESGQTAYLSGMTVYQQIDRFEQMMMETNENGSDNSDDSDLPF